MQAGLAHKETAPEAWEAIPAIRMGGHQIKEANAYRLRRDLTKL
jgi:hypothetical protein